MGKDIQAVTPAPIFLPGTTAHFQVNVPTTAGGVTLDSLLPGGAVPKLNTSVRPSAVYIAIQKGETNDVFFTFDGTSAPSAALGYPVPLGTPMYIPFQGSGYPDGAIKLIAITGAVKVQVKFDWNSAVG